MNDKEVQIHQSSGLQKALVNAFTSYVESGIYFGPPLIGNSGEYSLTQEYP